VVFRFVFFFFFFIEYFVFLTLKKDILLKK